MLLATHEPQDESEHATDNDPLGALMEHIARRFDACVSRTDRRPGALVLVYPDNVPIRPNQPAADRIATGVPQIGRRSRFQQLASDSLGLRLDANPVYDTRLVWDWGRTSGSHRQRRPFETSTGSARLHGRFSEPVLRNAQLEMGQSPISDCGAIQQAQPRIRRLHRFMRSSVKTSIRPLRLF